MGNFRFTEFRHAERQRSISSEFPVSKKAPVRLNSLQTSLSGILCLFVAALVPLDGFAKPFVWAVLSIGSHRPKRDAKLAQLVELYSIIKEPARRSGDKRFKPYHAAGYV